MADEVQPPKSGEVYDWRGLDGQHDTERWIRVDSMTATCGLNAVILRDPMDPGASEAAATFITIPFADFMAAKAAGALVLVNRQP